MVRQHHRLNGHEFEQTPGDSEGQESLACCSLWGHKEPDTTEQLSNIPLCEYTTLGLSLFGLAPVVVFFKYYDQGHSEHPHMSFCRLTYV